MVSFHKILDSLPRNLSVLKDIENGVARNEHSLPQTRAAFEALGYNVFDRINLPRFVTWIDSVLYMLQARKGKGLLVTT